MVQTLFLTLIGIIMVTIDGRNWMEMDIGAGHTVAPCYIKDILIVFCSTENCYCNEISIKQAGCSLTFAVEHPAEFYLKHFQHEAASMVQLCHAQCSTQHFLLLRLRFPCQTAARRNTRWKRNHPPGKARGGKQRFCGQRL